jgi:RHS repeat-associated protein
MRQLRFIFVALVVGITLLCSARVSAQSDPDFETGLKPFGSYHGGNIDTVNLSNGSLNITIPLMSYPQTGGKLKLDFAFRMSNFSYFYTVGYISCPDGSGNECATTDWETPGDFVGFTQEDVPMATGSWTDNGSEILGQAQITTPDQAIHQLGLTTLTGGSWRSADATGYAVAGTYYADFTGPVIDPGGVGYSGQALIPSGWYGASAKDANGNQISIQTNQYGTFVTQWTDSLGRTIPVPASTTDYSRCPNPSGTTKAMIWNFPGYNGQSQGYPVLFCYGSVPISYYYWYVPPYDGTGWQAQQSYNASMVEYIVLPDNTYWTFAYTTDGNGNPAQITFPTGGALCYKWNNFVGGNPDSNYQMESQVASRILDPSGTCSQSSPTWTYQRQGPSGGNVTVTDPAGNNTVHHFTIPTGLQTYYETETDYPGKTVYNTFAAAGSCGNGNGAVLTQTEMEWPTGQISKVQYGYDGGFTAGQPWETDNPPPYNPVLGGGSCLYGKRVSKQEYDYTGSLLRTTSTSYQFQNNQNYVTANLLDLPVSVQVTGAGPGSLTTYGYDENNGSPQCVCGNQTSVHRWLNTTGGYLTTNSIYGTISNNTNGLVTSTSDPKGNPTTYQYGSGYAGTGPTFVTNALGQTTSYTYDFNTGLLNSVKDPNGQNTGYTYDNMLRTTEIDYPDYGQTTYGYQGATEVQIGEQIDTGGDKKTWNLFVDGLGRLSETQLTSDPDGTDYTLTTYDGMGRKYKVYNPTRCSTITTNCGESTWGFATYQYDPLSRPMAVTDQDGSAVSTSYSGNSTTVTDEAGKTRQSYTDALGRLTSVIENPGGLNYSTTYGYDALDNLTGVAQAGSRQRSFGYDSLSRLTSATNPESGPTAYAYDNDGNAITKTDARGIVTCFGNWSGSCDGSGYDQLNRVTKKTYSDGSMVALYGYDVSSQFGVASSNPIGRLVYDDLYYPASASNQYSTWTVFGYDPMGRVTSQANCPPSPIVQCSFQANASISYDQLGDVASLTYPDGRVVKTYSVTGGKTAARPIQVTFDNFSGTYVGYNYLSAAHYAPDGSPANTSLGNGVIEASTYNDRLQPCNQQIATGASPWVNRSYSFYSSSSCTGSSGNNGNVMQIADGLQPNRTQNFSYDPLNRLASASTQGTSGPDCWGQSFSYDSWGNLSENATQCLAPSPNLVFGTNNQIITSGFQYDAAGNMTMGPNSGINYQYDAESRLINYASGAGVYTYDAEGNRVQKQVGGTTTDYFYFNGQPVAEYNPAAGDWSDYIYAGGRRIAKADSYENGIMIQGTNDGSSSWPNSWFRLNDANYLSGYTIQTGDHLYMRQYQDNARGGMGLFFGDGTNTAWQSTDQYGNYMNDDPNQLAWDEHSFDLTALAGEVVDWVGIDTDAHTPPGAWTVVYGDIAIVSADGTVRPIYSASANFSVSLQWAIGSTGVSVTNRHLSNIGWTPITTTNYYTSDHLGSARTLFSFWGYPTWSATFLPFGEEWNPEATVNHYKFTGKERDSESNLDNFGARYYTSQYGRFMTPDWAAKPTAVPYADFGNPQSLNLYSYVKNNPTTFADSGGHCSAPKVGQGQVGVCVDLYIQARILPKVAPGLGFGDGRGPAPNDPSKTYRQEIQLVVTPGSAPQKVKDDGGTSIAYAPIIGTLSGKGSSETSVSQPTIDPSGTEHFNISSIGLNGLASLPGAPKDTIKTSLNFLVTPEGKVGMDSGGMRTAYPSIEIYAYGADGSVRNVYQKTESGNVDDLKEQNQVVPAVDPQ